LTLSEVRLLVPFLTSPSCPRAMDRPVIHPRLAYPWEPSVPLNCPRSIVTHLISYENHNPWDRVPAGSKARRKRRRAFAGLPPPGSRPLGGRVLDKLLQRLRIEALMGAGTVGEDRFVKQVGNPGQQIQELR